MKASTGDGRQFSKDNLVDINPAGQIARLNVVESFTPQKRPMPANVFADQLG
jgi:hypothetical protein